MPPSSPSPPAPLLPPLSAVRKKIYLSIPKTEGYKTDCDDDIGEAAKTPSEPAAAAGKVGAYKTFTRTWIFFFLVVLECVAGSLITADGWSHFATPDETLSDNIRIAKQHPRRDESNQLNWKKQIGSLALKFES